jgi:8-oxo-dGTP pyrophosphatase MutT (NUDIX family)
MEIAGNRDPALLRLLAGRRPAAVHRESWGVDASMPLELASYLTPTPVPDPLVPADLVTSVRCLVSAPGGVVVCANSREQHVLPGGRREAGETFAATAAREVAEETGWRLDRGTLRPLGFLHLAHLGPRPAGYAYPYPDSLQWVFGAHAVTREVAPDAAWTDTEGWEIASRVVAVADLAALPLSPGNRAFLDAHLAGRTP